MISLSYINDKNYLFEIIHLIKTYTCAISWATINDDDMPSSFTTAQLLFGLHRPVTWA